MPYTHEQVCNKHPLLVAPCPTPLPILQTQGGVLPPALAASLHTLTLACKAGRRDLQPVQPTPHSAYAVAHTCCLLAAGRRSHTTTRVSATLLLLLPHLPPAGAGSIWYLSALPSTFCSNTSLTRATPSCRATSGRRK